MSCSKLILLSKGLFIAAALRACLLCLGVYTQSKGNNTFLTLGDLYRNRVWETTQMTLLGLCRFWTSVAKMPRAAHLNFVSLHWLSNSTLIPLEDIHPVIYFYCNYIPITEFLSVTYNQTLMDIFQSLYCNKQTQCAAYLINRLWLVPFPPQRVSGSAVISANFFDLTETQTATRIVLFPDKFILDSVQKVSILRFWKGLIKEVVSAV